jgi:hypothetical protein
VSIAKESVQQEVERIYLYVYSKKNDYERVPLTIRIINAVIHKLYEVEPSKARNYNLLNLLSQTAKLSSSLRSYLLVNSMVGRLLDSFYGELSKFKSIFCDIRTIPLYKTNVECFIPKIEQNGFLKDLDGTIGNDSRESSSFIETYHTFFYELVSNLVCSCKFKTNDLSQNHDTEVEASNESEESKSQGNESDKQEAIDHGMSPFFNYGDKPYELYDEEQALLLLPTEQMLSKLFKGGNAYLDCSKTLGKMYAHISWANKEFSKTYISLLTQFIQDSDYYDIIKKFKIPLVQVLLINDSEFLTEFRAKIVMKYLFSQYFIYIKDKYYVQSLQITQIIFYLAFNVKSISNILKKHRELIYPELLEFLSRDPVVSLNQMNWVQNIPRNSTTLNLNRTLMSEMVEEWIKLHIIDLRDKLELIFDQDPTEFITIEQTMQPLCYKNGDEINFFSEKYKDWIHAYVVQEISSSVVYIECELSSKEKNTPIFVFREVLESLDKRIFGDAIQEMETS